MIKSLVSRAVQASACAVALALTIASSTPVNAAPKPSNISLIPTVTGITSQAGQLLASGNVTAVVRGVTNVIPFSGVPVTLAVATNQAGAGACPILDLTLAPITLNVLGLLVQTSPICLNLTAYQNAGLLGDLLCSVANLLNGGLSLDQILGGLGSGLLPGLTTTQISTLLGSLQSLLNGALGSLANAVLVGSSSGTAQHQCGILHLALGPVDLTLLGLEVTLDNCANGPVLVDISAVNGSGNLLGNLLCGLVNGARLNLGTTLQQLLGLLPGL